MLTLNVAKLSAAQLSSVTAGQCARYGTVRSIKILPPAAHRNYAIAAVEMSTAMEADRLRVDLGDIKMGQVVVIRLMQESSRETEVAGEPDQEAASSMVSRDPVDILLIEDDPADVRMTREALNAAGVEHRLHVVTDGMEAVSFLCRTRQFDEVPRPDVVLLDLNLPKLNGHEVLLEIKSNDALRDIPVVVLTSSKAPRDKHLSYQADADWFVTKPTGFNAYVETMKRIESLITH